MIPPFVWTIAKAAFKYLPFGSTISAFLPALGGFASSVGVVCAAIAKVIAAFIEGALEAMHHPKVLLVIAAAFAYGLYYSKDKHGDALAAEKSRCEMLLKAKKPAVKRTKSPEWSVPSLTGWLPW